jgi:hypothetical protein
MSNVFVLNPRQTHQRHFQWIDNGWHLWTYNPPPYGVLIRWGRLYGDEPTVGYREEVNPFFNVNGLYWQLTGIGKIELQGEIALWRL